jgi:hypothetical protein
MRVRSFAARKEAMPLDPEEARHAVAYLVNPSAMELVSR